MAGAAAGDHASSGDKTVTVTVLPVTPATLRFDQPVAEPPVAQHGSDAGNGQCGTMRARWRLAR